MALDVYKEWLGIPEGPRPPDHYALLRLVRFEDDPEKIRKHYKKLNSHVRKYATGQYQQQSQDLLNELAKAMLCLTDADRKRDYDKSLGRVIDDRDQQTGRRPLTAYLQDEGLITADQVNDAKAQSERTGLSLRDVVVQLKLVDAEQATRAYASELGLSYLDLSEMVPEEAALDGLPKTVVRRYTCLPVFVDDERVLVACSDEPTEALEEEVRLRFGLPMRAVLSTPQSIRAAIDQYYAPGLRKEVAPKPAKKSVAGDIARKVTSSKPVSAMTEEEKAERKKLGIVVACWLVIVLVNLDAWVLWDLVWKRLGVPGVFPFVATVLISPFALFTIYQVYIRER